MDIASLPRSLKFSLSSGSHVQGIAVDTKRGYVYISFTTALMKADFNGNVIGTVSGITGHLGCIDYDAEHDLVFGSIEYKHDSIGKSIAKNIGAALADEDAFYMSIFDVDKIDRIDMDAERDGVMRAVYLPEVERDFSADENGVLHRYGCSGIDGTTIGVLPGTERKGLFVAYGIYSDLERTDNDDQVILHYDIGKLIESAQPLSQFAPHHCGIECEGKYFAHTGNTTYGIQNLEYDAYTGDFFAAVYKGKKPNFPNFGLFRIDGQKAADKNNMLSLSEHGIFDEASGTRGYHFSHGTTGLDSVGGGYFYISHHSKVENTYMTNIRLYRYTGDADNIFEIVE